MPRSSSAIKALRSSRRKRSRNVDAKEALRKAVKAVRVAVSEKNKDAATQALRKAQQLLDKAVKTNLIHKNTSSRKKSRLSALVKTLTK